MSAEQNIELMQTLDDAWNTQDWDTFDQRHKTGTIVRWPGQPPTHGKKAHHAEGVQMFQTFPDNRVGLPDPGRPPASPPGRARPAGGAGVEDL